jgi:hypothetical protein
MIARGKVCRGAVIHHGQFRKCAVMREAHELVRILERQWLEEYAVDDAEDRGAGADAESEGERGCDRESAMLDQCASGVAQILPDAGHDSFLRMGTAGIPACCWLSSSRARNGQWLNASPTAATLLRTLVPSKPFSGLRLLLLLEYPVVARVVRADLGHGARVAVGSAEGERHRFVRVERQPARPRQTLRGRAVHRDG